MYVDGLVWPTMSRKLRPSWCEAQHIRSCKNYKCRAWTAFFRVARRYSFNYYRNKCARTRRNKCRKHFRIWKCGIQTSLIRPDTINEQTRRPARSANFTRNWICVIRKTRWQSVFRSCETLPHTYTQTHFACNGGEFSVIAGCRGFIVRIEVASHEQKERRKIWKMFIVKLQLILN